MIIYRGEQYRLNYITVFKNNFFGDNITLFVEIQ